MDRLAELKRLEALEGQESLRWKLYEEEVPGRRINNIWAAPMSPTDKLYVVQTATKAIQRCILMTTDPGDLVFDPTCGSGTTAYVAEQWGRRWITCDTSRVAVAVARHRLMTVNYDYFKLSYPDEGVGAGFRHKGVPKVSPRTLGYNEPPTETILYDQPEVDRARRASPGRSRSRRCPRRRQDRWTASRRWSLCPRIVPWHAQAQLCSRATGVTNC